jgi:hypothetical protein
MVVCQCVVVAVNIQVPILELRPATRGGVPVRGRINGKKKKKRARRDLEGRENVTQLKCLLH